MPRTVFYGIMVIAAVFAVAIGARLLYDGSLWLAALPVIVSPLAMITIRICMEGGRPFGLCHWKVQSWAFLFGDSIALPLTFVFIALGWRRLDRSSWWLSPSWALAALVASVVITAIWRYSEIRGYTAAGYTDLLGSPTKLWHDYVVYGSLSMLLVWGGIPVLATQWRGWGALTLVAMVGWLALGIADGIRGLDIGRLHPPVQQTTLRE